MANSEMKENTSFLFTVSTPQHSIEMDPCNMLVDCGATAHIITDKSKFVRLNKNFDMSKHIIKLADGNRSNDIVQAKGDVMIFLKDNKGRKQK